MTTNTSAHAREFPPAARENPQTAAMRRRDAEPPGDGAEARITHVIPSVELTGSREQKVQTLDTLIAHLEQLRRNIAGDTILPVRGGFEGPSRYALTPAWPWFVAGMAVSAALLCLALFFLNS